MSAQEKAPHPSLRGFLSALCKKFPPQPLSRSIAVPASEAAGPSKIDWQNAPVLSSLLLLVAQLDNLPPSLAGGFPTINPGSTPVDIAKANAAASHAFDFLVEGLKQHGVELIFNVYHSSVEGRPSQAYFVLHHGYTNCITPNTIAITEMYDAWLQSDFFAR